MTGYEAYAKRIAEGGIVIDPWLAGAPRFRKEPLVLSIDETRGMYRAAEAVAEAYDELCLIVADAPDFLDTPTGEAEAIVTGALAMRASCIDPNRNLERRIVDVAEALWNGTIGERRAALLYPTEIPEDLSLVRLYKRAFEARGWDLVLGSPFNVENEGGTLTVFGEPVSLVLRHYKTDWWSERQSAWDDEEVPDTEPLDGPLEAILCAMLESKVAVVSPFGAVVPQNKRAMAFMWERIHLFSKKSQETIRAFVPPTRRLDAVHAEQLLAEKDDWVLKSDYGAEGDEVVIGKLTTPEVWRESIAHARPSRWIVQRYFQAKENEAKESVNHGVYVIAGGASGIYARVQRVATDETALSVPALIEG